MKADKLLQFLCLLLLMLVASCTDDTFMEDRIRVEEGLPAHVQLKFQAEAGQVITRAEQTSEYENRVENIYIFVFDESGAIHFRKFCTEGDGLSFADGTTEHSSGFIEFSTSSLNKATIVGIANLNTATSGTAFPVTKEQMESITSLNELKAYVMKMTKGSISRGGLFMMTGYAKDTEGNFTVTIPGSEGGQPDELNATLQLERTDAKVKFVITTEPANPAWKNFSFMPRTWEVKRVPQQSYLLENETGDYDGEEAVYFNTPAVAFEGMFTDPNNSNLYTGGSFVFYMPENQKKPKQDVENYADRDSWEGTDEQGNRTFTNANPNSTYVEMTGTLSYQDGKNMLVNADVRFIVHLGYVTSRNGESVEANPNDYNTERNGFYTYNVKVKGVNNIIVEVTEGKDVRPGYEGDVVYSTTDIFEFDSHYDRRLINLNRSAIGSNMKWSVSTPFSRGIHDMTTDDGQENPIPQSMRDYRWIKFAINYDYAVDKNLYVKYPGDQNYNDPYPITGAANNEPSPYFSSGGAGYNASRGTEKARLLDVDQLIRRLQEEVKKDNSPIFDENGDVAITVFVDEYLYFNHPLTNQPGEENRTQWKLTADKEDRQLHIIAQGSQMSPDGNSSIVNSIFSFKQRTIRTIFNVDKPELKTAWGLESVTETKRMSKKNIPYGSSTSNGRLNTLDIMLGTSHNNVLHWTDVLNTNEYFTLNSNYEDPVYACLLRNRDLNGDNIVQSNEVRWYLAAIDQLTDIYLGEYALDEQSRLYPTNPADRENQVRWHYISSSAEKNNNAWILWAEEGASRGAHNAENAGTVFSYRCVRNLGLALSNPDEEPQDLIEVKNEGGGFYLIDVTNMNIKSRRTNYEVNPLPLHNERSANNLPYAKFRVHANTYGGDGKEPYVDQWNANINPEWNDYPWGSYQTFRGYPAGYRIPNQRELLIMTTRMPSEAWEEFSDSKWFPFVGTVTRKKKPSYICQTAFSLDGQEPEYNANRDGFLWNSYTGEFFLQNKTSDEGYVRPVQDVQE